MMRSKTSTLSLENTPQVWAHKGYHKGITGNTIAAYKKAFEVGARGIELDTHFDTNLGKFVISHDFPYRRHEGKLLYLDDVFAALGKAGYFWLDFKNLSSDNLEPAAAKMEELLDRYDLRKLVFIESWHKEDISRLSTMGFQTLFWIGPSHEPGSLDHLLELHKIRSIIIRSNFSAVSGNFETLGRYADDLLNDFPVFLFTVNKQLDIEKISKNPRVKVILTDNPEFYQ